MSALARASASWGQLPLDAEYLREQTGALPERPLDHYLACGLKHRLNPTRWFVTDWYHWQNPDWIGHPTPYQHYMDVGRQEGRDPSPFVDTTRYADVTGLDPAAIYAQILGGQHSVALGTYESARDLAECQQRFLDAIELVVHREPATATGRRALVVLQAGRGALSDSWFDEERREWDLLVNYYDASGFRAGFGDYVLFQKGTKFTAMWMLWRHFKDILLRYDHVLFLDDDVETSCGALNLLFETCRTFGLSLAQMALCDRSSCNWPDLFAQPGHEAPRAVSAVEIMMPVFSRAALAQVASTFGRSISGYGLDLAWGKIVSEAGGKIAVLDNVVATHERAVDHQGGAFYAYLRRHMINPKAELWTLLQDYDADRNLGSDPD